MASLPQRLGSQFLFLTRQTTSTAWCNCTSTLASMPQTRFLLLNNCPTAVIRSRLFHGVIRRVKLSKNLPPAPRRHASSTAAKKPAAPTISTIKPTASVLRSYVERLATKGSRTFLYEAPSHFWYRVSSFAAGAFCITYTVVQYWEVYLHPREGLASWVPHAFGVICIFMTAMGLYFILGTQHIVRSIEVVPRALLSKKQLLSLPKTASETPILIQVSMQRPAPFLPMKKKLYTPEEIQLPFRMHGVLGNLLPGQIPSTPKQVTMVESVRAERAAREARAKEIQFRRDHILTSPFRDGAKVGKQVAGGVWSSIKRPFFREGFAKILLGKAEYRLDISGGWALDDGRAMDRLFTIRPAPGVAQ